MSSVVQEAHIRSRFVDGQQRAPSTLVNAGKIQSLRRPEMLKTISNTVGSKIYLPSSAQVRRRFLWLSVMCMMCSRCQSSSPGNGIGDCAEFYCRVYDLMRDGYTHLLTIKIIFLARWCLSLVLDKLVLENTYHHHQSTFILLHIDFGISDKTFTTTEVGYLGRNFTSLGIPKNFSHIISFVL